jgi:hypothetical protein
MENIVIRFIYTTAHRRSKLKSTLNGYYKMGSQKDTNRDSYVAIVSRVLSYLNRDGRLAVGHIRATVFIYKLFYCNTRSKYIFFFF